MVNTSGCKGCYLSDESNMICTVLISHRQYIKECPCRICIVKIMCSDGCEKFFEFKDKCRGDEND